MASISQPFSSACETLIILANHPFFEGTDYQIAVSPTLFTLYTHGGFNLELSSLMLLTRYLFFNEMKIRCSQKALEEKPCIAGQRWAFWGYTGIRKWVRTGNGTMLSAVSFVHTCSFAR